MKVPFTANQAHHLLSANVKPLNVVNTALQVSINTSSTATNLSYEPKSVLELRGSPSPGSDKPGSNTDNSVVSDDPIQLEDHVLNQFEDWDSFMKDLGLNNEDNISNLKPNVQFNSYEFQTQYPSLPELSMTQSYDDSTQFTPPEFTLSETSQFPLLSHSNTNPFDLSDDIQHMDDNWNEGFDYVDELIRFAECFETHSLQLAHVILGRLNQRLRSASGKPLQRAAFYFKEALQTLLTGSTRPPTSSSDVIQTIKAQKAFSNISPIPMFSSFTANQAVLEAVDGSTIVHIIDFDISLGGHWASFMRELADKAESRKTNSPYLRITALVPEEYAMESKLIRENLSQFAREFNIGFDIDFVLFRTFEYLSFKAIKFMEGEKVVVLVSPSIFRRVGTGFANDLRRLSPHVVVHVDTEGSMGFETNSVRQTVIDGLEFYSTVLESLEAANACSGGGVGEWMRRIETFVLFPKITEAVEAASRGGTPWREAFVAAGLRPVGLSQFADCQAECLLRRVQVRGFHVAKRQAEMLLCWHERALVATSAWRC